MILPESVNEPPVEPPVQEPPVENPPMQEPPLETPPSEEEIAENRMTAEGDPQLPPPDPDPVLPPPPEPQPPAPDPAPGPPLAPDPDMSAATSAPDLSAAVSGPDMTAAASEPAVLAATPHPQPPSQTPVFWLLSLFTPAADDTVDWARGDYTVLARGGRVESPAGSGELKKQVQMIAEGSVLYSAGVPRGAAADVAPEGFAHPVFRAGFALSIPLPNGERTQT
jgi:hypothetical protein